LRNDHSSKFFVSLLHFPDIKSQHTENITRSTSAHEAGAATKSTAIEASRGKADCLLTQNSKPMKFSQLGVYELLALSYAANSLSTSSAVDEDELPAV